MIRFIRHHSASIAALDLAIIAIGGIASAYMKTEIEREEREILRTSGRAPAAVLNVTEFDWGEISRTQIAQQDFLISNRGNADLTISTIATSCGSHSRIFSSATGAMRISLSQQSPHRAVVQRHSFAWTGIPRNSPRSSPQTVRESSM